MPYLVVTMVYKDEKDTEIEHVMEFNEEDENEYEKEAEAEHVMELNEEDVSEYESEREHSMEDNESELLVNFQGIVPFHIHLQPIVFLDLDLNSFLIFMD